MGHLSAIQLQELIGKEEYEQNLVIDRLARELGISEEVVREEMKAVQEGSSSSRISKPPIKSNIKKSRFNFLRRKKKEEENAPDFLEESQKFRVSYDPSHDGLKRQKQVSQAIMCPSCSSPLGIPDIRPILVMCPACGVETNYEN
tara:strand:- start:22178 stop:22612 length:435 start_codon:yes stop_codon:yes gene_type:complete